MKCCDAAHVEFFVTMICSDKVVVLSSTVFGDGARHGFLLELRGARIDLWKRYASFTVAWLSPTRQTRRKVVHVENDQGLNECITKDPRKFVERRR